MRPVSVGVDFGTSNTVIALVDDQHRATVLQVASRNGSAAALPPPAIDTQLVPSQKTITPRLPA